MGVVLEIEGVKHTRPTEIHFNPTLNARELKIGQEYAAAHDGLLPDDPFWDNLRYRHTINAARFDHYHPRIAGMLDRDAAVRLLLAHPVTKPETVTPVKTVTPPRTVTTDPPVTKPIGTVTHTGSGGGGSEHPIPITTASVPEPSPMALLGVALAAAAVFRAGRKSWERTRRSAH
jgi:hypothetical protein